MVTLTDIVMVTLCINSPWRLFETTAFIAEKAYYYESANASPAPYPQIFHSLQLNHWVDWKSQ